MEMRASHVIVAGVLAAVASAAIAQPMEMPARRAGQWQMTMSGMGGERPGMSMTMCVNPATERSFSPFGGPNGHRGGEEPACSKHEVHPVPGGWAFESICPGQRGGVTATSGVVTGDFRTHIHMVVDTKGDRGDRHMVMDQTWLGPCPAGGDGRTITLPDGRSITIPSH
jgi:hypothetical protein